MCNVVSDIFTLTLSSPKYVTPISITLLLLHFQPIDEQAVPGGDVSSAFQHHVVATAHFHHAPVPQATPVLPSLDF